MRSRSVTAAAALLCVGLAAFASTHRAARAQSAPSCGETQQTVDGVGMKVLFAKNGAVQQYVVVHSSGRVDADHDALMAIERRYGPEGANAPPLRITGFRPSSSGMMTPSEATDSCGRKVRFK